MLISACSRSKTASNKAARNPFYPIASEFLQKDKNDSAFVYFSRAKEWYYQAKDTVGAGVSMINMALISTDLADHYGGQELSLEAAASFDENNPQHHAYLLSIYNNLGIASYGLKQYPKAIEFYSKSLQFISDSSHARIVKNNIANAYRKAGKTDDAIRIYRSVLKEELDTINRARTLSNYTYTRWLTNPAYNAEPGLREALALRLKSGGLFDQNSSYAHLADYYTNKNRDSALHYSTKMYHASSILSSAPDQLEALQKLISLSPPEDSKRYFNRYLVLEDSIQNAANNAKNQFALIRYETEKHKADNLTLQHTNTVRNAWIISLAAILIIGSIVSILLYRRRVKYLALKAAKDVRESQLRTSKKVHDVVANGLYKVMSEVEHNTAIDREKVLDDLENLYEKSRDISYDEICTTDDENFTTTIAQLIKSFATPATKVLVAGNNEEIWTGLGGVARTELKYVIQELMVNMTKHSKASSVVIKFERNGDKIGVNYTDDGAGIPEGTKFNNGLTNTGNRIKSIGGNITFGTGTTGGLKVQIQIPVSQ